MKKLNKLFIQAKNYLNISFIDLIFIIFCFILLLIPMSNINKNNISTKEGRILVDFPHIINENKTLNFNFGKDFEKWINDRFSYRDNLIDLYSKIRLKIAYRYYITSDAFFDKKTLWEFNRPEPIVIKISEKKTKRIINSINEFQKFCNKNNIKLYILITPYKNSIYMEETYIKKEPFDRSQIFIENIKKSDVPIIYPYDNLKTASKEDYVFFKADHHWTDYGAFIGYKALIKEIKKDFPNIKEVKLSDFNINKSKSIRSEWERDFSIGTMHKALNMDEETTKNILTQEYKYFTHKNHNLLKTNAKNISKLKEKNFYYPKGSNEKTLIIGTSMCENLNEILPYTFKQTKYYRLNKVKDIPKKDTYKILKRLEEKIIEYKPDILIICLNIKGALYLDDINKKD